MTNLAILHSQVLFIDCLSSSLSTQTDLQLVLSTSKLDELDGLLQLKKVDVVLLDQQLSNYLGSSCFAFLRRQYPSIPLILILNECDLMFMSSMISKGVSALITKGDDLSVLISAIHMATKGHTYFENLPARLKKSGTSVYNFQSTLTQQELIIFKMISDDLTNREIALQLNLSIRTVEWHRSNIVNKTKCKTIRELKRIYWQFNRLSI